jgi:hypothetical protein
MRSLPFEQGLLVLIQAVVLLALCIRLWWAGLHRVYVYFFSYLLVTFVQTCVPLVVPFDSPIYRNVWLVTESVVVCFYVLVVLELYSVILRNLAGIATLSRRYIQISVGAAVAVSLLLLGLEKTSGGTLAHFFVFERAIMFSLVLFLLLLTAFLVYYPVPLKRNVIVYSIGYAVYFLAKAAAIFINNLGYYWNRQLSNVRLAACLACLVFWLFALNREGETKTVVLGHHWSAEDEERLLAQLKAINTTLARSARK